MQVTIKTCSSVVKPKAMGIQSVSIYSHYLKSNVDRFKLLSSISLPYL